MKPHEGGDLRSSWHNHKGELIEVRVKGIYGPKGKMKFIYKGKYDPELAETFLFKWGFTKLIEGGTP